MKRFNGHRALAAFFLGLILWLPAVQAQALILLKPLYTISRAGTRVGELLNPQGLAIDPAGNVYVADTGNNRIQKFAPDGTPIAQMGGLGSGNQQFDAPLGICASNGLFEWVADYNNQRLQRLDRNLNAAGTLASDENWPLRFQFQLPVDVVESGQGDLFVADGARNEVVKFDSFHKPVAVFGGLDAGEHRIQEIGKIALRATERIFVSDRLTAAVLIFDYFGNFLGVLRCPDFQEPFGLAVWAKQAILFVSDAQSGRIFAFDVSGQNEPVRILDAGKQFRLKRPVALAVFKQKLFVLDEATSQILVLGVERIRTAGTR